MIFKRAKYLQSLIDGRGDGLVKIVTGVRRSGKSFLLFNLWHGWLVANGVDESHIIELQFDDRANRRLRDPDVLLDYIGSRLSKDGQPCYVILDEVQLIDDFVEVILNLTHVRDVNVDVYVSGSNSRFLSSDVATEFRGRGSEIRVWPLSFAEYYGGVGGSIRDAWNDYYTFGGLPQVARLKGADAKIGYLKGLYETTYLRDVIDRNRLRNADGLRELVHVLASGIGSLTNVRRIADTFKSTRSSISMKPETIKGYIDCLKDAFLIEEAMRYDVKGRRYIGAEAKYYFADVGLRAAILDFRQQEEPHIMENIIYNELRYRGYSVDVGIVETWSKTADGKSARMPLEVDFVANRPPRRYYIQSAFRMSTPEKEAQEHRPLLSVNDHFRKMVIVGDDIHRKEDDHGILTMGILDFLVDDSVMKE